MKQVATMPKKRSKPNLKLLVEAPKNAAAKKSKPRQEPKAPVGGWSIPLSLDEWVEIIFEDVADQEDLERHKRKLSRWFREQTIRTKKVGNLSSWLHAEGTASCKPDGESRADVRATVNEKK